MQEQMFLKLGNRIRLRRKELGLSQSKLAELLDISNNHMSAIENGREKPSMDKFIHICDLLKTTPDFLLLGSIHPNNAATAVSSVRLSLRHSAMSSSESGFISFPAVMMVNWLP